MSTQSIPPPSSSTVDDAAAFQGNLHITNPWHSLDLDSFQLLAGVHVPAHFAARLPPATIGQASTTPSALLYGTTAGSHSPPRSSAAVRLCRDDPNCTREDCYFAHTNKATITMAPTGRCSYGSRCTRNGCALSHDENDEESISPTASPSFKSLVAASSLSVHAPVFELNDDIVLSPPSTGRYPKSAKVSNSNYYDDATANVSGTGAGVANGYWSGTGRRTSPTSTPTSRSPTRSTSPTSLATIPRPVNVTPMRRVNANGSNAPTMGGRSDTANAWTTVRRGHRHNNSQGHSPSRSRGHWHQQHSNTMVSVSA